MARSFEMFALRRAGLSLTEIGALYGVSKQAVFTNVRRQAGRPMTLERAYDLVLFDLRIKRDRIAQQIRDLEAASSILRTGYKDTFM